MTTLIVLFNLKPGADPAEYEAWAAATDLPTVKGLKNCEGFDLYRTSELLGKGEAAPYQYVEKIDITDLAEFRKETSGATMQAVAAAFREFADNPLFMVSERISS